MVVYQFWEDSDGGYSLIPVTSTKALDLLGEHSVLLWEKEFARYSHATQYRNKYMGWEDYKAVRELTLFVDSNAFDTGYYLKLEEACKRFYGEIDFIKVPNSTVILDDWIPLLKDRIRDKEKVIALGGISFNYHLSTNMARCSDIDYFYDTTIPESPVWLNNIDNTEEYKSIKEYIEGYEGAGRDMTELVFIKPASGLKQFGGILEEVRSLKQYDFYNYYLGRVQVSHAQRILSEYRIIRINGENLYWSQYGYTDDDYDEPALSIGFNKFLREFDFSEYVPGRCVVDVSAVLIDGKVQYKLLEVNSIYSSQWYNAKVETFEKILSVFLRS